MNEPRRNDWSSPSNMIAVVMALGTVGSFWVSFDRRVTNTENAVIAVAKELDEHKTDEEGRLLRIEEKVDRLIERGGK